MERTNQGTLQYSSLYGAKTYESYSYLPKKKQVTRVCQAGLIVVLIVTLMINISFIIETNKKLKRDQIRDSLLVESGKTRNVLDNKGDDPVVAMGMIENGAAGKQTISVEVLSSKELAAVSVDSKNVLFSDKFEVDRGIHILVLNQATGVVMATRVFDTYLEHEDEAMVLFLNMISPGRILVFAIKDEGTFHLKNEAKQVLTELGSESAQSLYWRDMWAFVTIKGGKALGEKLAKSTDVAKWGDKVSLKTTVELAPIADTECKWDNSDTSRRRREFCNKLEGYGSVCSCQDPAPIDFVSKPLESGRILDIPVAVIASNRPHYLYRMLRTILQVPGVPADKITVFIDGFLDEPLEVCRLLNVRGIQHTPLGVKNARITQHYRASLSATFGLFPEAEYAIVIEEDLDVSLDFFNYFEQTMSLLDDSTVYCISAWNDQGYEHSCKDPALLYRIETMPGLGWMLKKSLFKDELEPQWPSYDKQWDWDMWMRTPMIRKDRECIIPDISRTYHFGSKGLNINPYFQELYFQKHSLMAKPNVKLKDIDRMKSDRYEVLVCDLIKSAKVLDHSKDPCAEDFIPQDQGETFVLYIKMKEPSDFETWKNLAKCYHLWDLDVRGFHKSMWRQFLKDKHIVIVGVPASPYSDLKPSDITPVFIEDKKDKQKER